MKQGRRFRIVPFETIEDKKPCFTLVIEWLENKQVVCDQRHQMSKKQFLQLRREVNKQKPGER